MELSLAQKLAMTTTVTMETAAIQAVLSNRDTPVAELPVTVVPAAMARLVEPSYVTTQALPVVMAVVLPARLKRDTSARDHRVAALLSGVHHRTSQYLRRVRLLRVI
jgi:hypothetical protein